MSTKAQMSAKAQVARAQAEKNIQDAKRVSTDTPAKHNKRKQQRQGNRSTKSNNGKSAKQPNVGAQRA